MVNDGFLDVDDDMAHALIGTQILKKKPNKYIEKIYLDKTAMQFLTSLEYSNKKTSA